MAINLLIAFWTVSILFVITPGVDWAYAISAGMRGRVVVPAVTGLILGHFIATLIVAAGVGVIVSSMPLAMTTLTIIGASYLMWIGIQLSKSPPKPGSDSAFEQHSWWRWLTKGTCVSGLNPKVFLLFLALLPQFTDPTSDWPISSQIVTLGLIHIISCTIVYLIVGYSAQFILSTRPKAALMVGRVSGVLMIFIALGLLAEQAALFI
uniref:Lysine exporter protein n=1 Tax=Providencia alcalifaciens Ban1 TaxID=663916 RepID=C9E4H5_9GAMM|nr:lysine exporter protein [Providencia alcalifaciens Ban1]